MMRLILLLFIFTLSASQTSAQTTINIMDSVVFYDGYAGLVDTIAPPGVIMHRNDLFARKLTNAELESIGDSLQMNILISALCDNYDRLGYVNMALVHKDSTNYNPDSVQRIELGRFITPFFNKNKSPKSVPYTFNIDNVASLLKDADIINNYAIWIELEVFGVPYAANTQVAGCSGRNDVFMGKLDFVTNSPSTEETSNLLLPLFFKNSFNNYQANATDTLGKTTKKITFNVPEDVTDAVLYLITSNHGANTGGEEYNRRFHYAYYDDSLKLSYKPGRLTCEPFRQYNTQGNGIYGSSPKSPAQWQSFSNWCPGDVIDIRKIELDSVSAGQHTFLITVPDAIFNGGEGYIPLSLYFQATKAKKATGINEMEALDHSFSIYPNPTSGNFTIDLSSKNAEIQVTDIQGKEIIKLNTSQKLNKIQLDNNGIYFIIVKTKQGTTTKKLVVSK